MSFVHKVRIDRLTGEVINYEVIESNEKINNKPLIDYLYTRMERDGVFKKPQSPEQAV